MKFAVSAWLRSPVRVKRTLPGVIEPSAVSSTFATETTFGSLSLFSSINTHDKFRRHPG
jgi:hypothetical protein